MPLNGGSVKDMNWHSLLVLGVYVVTEALFLLDLFVFDGVVMQFLADMRQIEDLDDE